MLIINVNVGIIKKKKKNESNLQFHTKQTAISFASATCDICNWYFSFFPNKPSYAQSAYI